MGNGKLRPRLALFGSVLALVVIAAVAQGCFQVKLPEKVSVNTAPLVSIDTSPYLGQGDKYDCANFASQAEAQAVLRADPSDPNKLDPNKTGIACRDNPEPFDLDPVPRT